ncbi:MAG: PEP-CTERM sorting domain-containing protein [Verrucomicrobiota bacterium]|jgi:hypothetical protein
MKSSRIIGLVAVSLTLLQTVSGQSFVNLNFESARIIPLTNGADFPPYSVATTNAVPGWTVNIGGTQQSQITYNAPALGSTFVTLWATNGQQITGNYSVLLQGGETATAASISQTGLVPASAESLLFEAQPGLGRLLVSFRSENLSFFALGTGSNYTLYGADISAFADKIETLTFSALEDTVNPNNWNIDNIQFSSSPVPEPSALSLFSICVLFLCWRMKLPNMRIGCTASFRN